MPFPMPANESGRLAAVRAFNIFGTRQRSLLTILANWPRRFANALVLCYLRWTTIVFG